MKQENCNHRSFELIKSSDWNRFKCQWCDKLFSDQEIKKLMLERRQGFGDNEEVKFEGYISTKKG